MTPAMNIAAIAVAAGVAVFAARTNIASIHLAAMGSVAAASRRLAPVQAPIGTIDAVPWRASPAPAG